MLNFRTNADYSYREKKKKRYLCIYLWLSKCDIFKDIQRKKYFLKRKIITKKRNGVYIFFFRLERKKFLPQGNEFFSEFCTVSAEQSYNRVKNWNRGISFRASTRLPRPIDFNPKFQRRSRPSSKQATPSTASRKFYNFPPWSTRNVICDTDFSNSLWFSNLPSSKIKLLKIRTR